MIPLKSCPVCESQSIVEYRVVTGGFLRPEIMPGVEVDTAIITRYCICQNCRLIFQNPRLSDKELDRFYNQGYYRSLVSQPEEGMDAGELNRAKLDAEIIKKNIGNVSSHLDVGCGLGYLLEAVGMDVRVGVESDIDYVKVKGIEVYPEMDKVSRKSFDLITAIHVLEHVPHPLDFLKKIVKFVSKSGFLVIEVPSSKTTGGPFGFMHLHYFETDVLKLLCAKVGFHVMHMEFTPHLLLICTRV